MAASCTLKRIAFKELRLLYNQGQVWYRPKRCYSSSDSKKDDNNAPPKYVPKGLFGRLKMPPKDIEQHPDILENPVRNTEREYYETHLNPDWEGHQRSAFESRFYSKKHGPTPELMSWLHWDININDDVYIDSLLSKRLFASYKKDQSYMKERTLAVGRELGAAHFIVARGGSIKFLNRDTWFKKDASGQYALPRVKVDNMYLEAIDASDMKLTYVAFDNLEGLSKLRFMRLHNCPYIDDWCLARLQRLRGSLEYLDISNCPNITDNGLVSLQCLHKLKVLRVSNLPKVKFLGLITLLLEEQLPDLTVLGVSENDLKPPRWDHRGETRLVRAFLGLLDDENEQEDKNNGNEYVREVGNTKQRELRRFVRKLDS